MKNKGLKFLTLVVLESLCLSTLVGCKDAGSSSAVQSGLMDEIKEDADSAANTDNTDDTESDKEDDGPSDNMIGKYVSQGYENPSFGFAISLPENYSLTSRASFTAVDQDVVESSNSENTYDSIRSYVSLGTNSSVFEASDGTTFIYLSLQKASTLDDSSVWDDEKTIAENSVFTEEDIKEYYGDDVEITDFQNNVEEIQFLGAKHYAGQYTFKENGVPFYGATIFIVSEEDGKYLLSINVNGTDLNAVDQADSFFSTL